MVTVIHHICSPLPPEDHQKPVWFAEQELRLSNHSVQPLKDVRFPKLISQCAINVWLKEELTFMNPPPMLWLTHGINDRTDIMKMVPFKGSICHLQWVSEGRVMGLSVSSCGCSEARERHAPPKAFQYGWINVCAGVIYRAKEGPWSSQTEKREKRATANLPNVKCCLCNWKWKGVGVLHNGRN